MTIVEQQQAGRESLPPRSRLDEGFEEYAAAFLAAHPEISAVIPSWADEVSFSEIEDEFGETTFSFTTKIRDVELYGCGWWRDGTVHLVDGGRPNIYVTGELRADSRSELTEWAREVAADLIAAAGLLERAS
ncbi:hypothetical protein ABE10_11035 [Bacillus toyonensis]|nr:hypothetical protein [Bacillus toyonensis]